MKFLKAYAVIAAWLAATVWATADPSMPLPIEGEIPRAVPVTEGSETVPDGFRLFGDYILDSRVKVTDGVPQIMPIKPLRLRVFTDGISVRVQTEGEDAGQSKFKIYRADGVGRQSEKSAAVEIIPGVQALSEQSGIIRHLRLSRETLTLTVFPGVSNQTIISTARAATGISPGSPPMSQGPRP
jgi:hypothetical protein